MKRYKQIVFVLIYLTCFLCLIIDARTVAFSCRDAVELCIYTVIPSLFPFITISTLLNNSLSGSQPKFLRSLGKFLNIPVGAEGMLLLGFLGGYPIGAQAVAEGYHSGALQKDMAHRMLGFCSNAGPAFVFGMISGMFSNMLSAWCLWIIHVLSGCIVGFLLPRCRQESHVVQKAKQASVSMVLEKSLKTTGIICGWVILFRILTGFMDKWFFAGLPSSITQMIQGLMELTNGCITSEQIQSEGLRFIYMSTILGFGGLCVLGQTAAVTRGLGLGYYFPGKVLQASISLLLSILIQPILFAQKDKASIHYLATSAAVLVFILVHIWLIRKKTVAFSGNSMYNEENITL